MKNLAALDVPGTVDESQAALQPKLVVGRKHPIVPAGAQCGSEGLLERRRADAEGRLQDRARAAVPARDDTELE